MKILQPTSISLHSYGGEELSIIRQVTCFIGCGEISVESVPKGALVNLLLGTDLPQLDSQKKGNCMVDVLNVTPQK